MYLTIHDSIQYTIQKNQKLIHDLTSIIRASPSGVPNAKYLAFGTSNTKNRASWGVLNVSKFWDMLQYRSTFGTVWTCVKKKIYSTFSLSSQYCIQLFLSLLTDSTRVLSLSFFFKSDSLTLPHPHRSSRCHRLWFEDSIVTDLKQPLSLLIWSSPLVLFNFLMYISATSLIWNSPIWSCVVHNSRHWWLVEFGHWLIYWVRVLLKILSFFFWLRFLDLEFVGGSSDCGCSLWRWLLVLGWWRLPLDCAIVYLLGFEEIYYLMCCIYYFNV